MDALLEAFGIDWKLLIVQLVNFGILILALWHFLYKPVLKMLEERKQLVAKGVADAEAATEKLATADSEAAHRVQNASLEAEGIVASAREHASEEKARIVKEAEARAAASLKDAEARAAEAAAKALRESEKEIARLAILAAEKVAKTRS